MEKLWTGRLNASLNSAAEDFNSSIRTDSRMFREDIEGSQAHAKCWPNAASSQKRRPNS